MLKLNKYATKIPLSMTKEQLVEHTGKNLYQIWLEMAMRHFDYRDPELSFAIARAFLSELEKQNLF